MDKLIAKLEAASEGSRTLDVEIWCAINPTAANSALKRAAYDTNGRAVPQMVLEDRAPRYSTSIDAALELLPVNYGWKIANENDYQSPYAVVWMPHAERPRTSFFVEQKPIPIAICIAALRARAAK